jgi:molybdopterin-guanine dinucleotide biosynthesis protein
MNKIVWVIGQSAAGKATFIENAVINPDSELMQKLGYSNSKIIPLNESLYFDDDERYKIIDLVLNLIQKETNAVILIKWQHPDTETDVIGKLKVVTPDTSNEIVCLSVDSDVLFARLQRKPWWENDPNYSIQEQQKQMDHIVEVMRNNIKKYLFRTILVKLF